MQMKKTIAGYAAIFVATFVLSLGIAISFAGSAAACSTGPCYVFWEELPSEAGSCAGKSGTEEWSGSQGSNPVTCCGTVVAYHCH